MIHTVENTFVPYASRHTHPAHRLTPAAEPVAWRGQDATPVHTHSPYAYSAEADLGSLWDPSVLDRLQAPLTRYHE
jgi:hypothetical protein